MSTEICPVHVVQTGYPSSVLEIEDAKDAYRQVLREYYLVNDEGWALWREAEAARERYDKQRPTVRKAALALMDATVRFGKVMSDLDKANASILARQDVDAVQKQHER